MYANDDFYFNNVNISRGGVKVKDVKSESQLGHTLSFYRIIDIQSRIKGIKVRTNIILSQFRWLNWQAMVKIFSVNALLCMDVPCGILTIQILSYYVRHGRYVAEKYWELCPIPGR